MRDPSIHITKHQFVQPAAFEYQMVLIDGFIVCIEAHLELVAGMQYFLSFHIGLLL